MPEQESAKRRSTRSIGFWVRLVVSAAIITYLFATRISVEQVLQAIRTCAPGYLLAAFGLHFVGFTLSSLRWRLLLRALSGPISLWRLMRAYLVGMFCNQFLPSTIGGDVYRGLDAAAMTGLPRGQSLAIVALERFIGALALFSYALVALVFGFGHLIDKPGVAASVGLLGVGFLGVFAGLTPWGRQSLRRLMNLGPFRRLLPSLDRAFAAVKDLGRDRARLAGATAISLVFQFNVVVHYILIGYAFHLSVPLGAYFLVVPVVLLILQVPLSLNGIGVREMAFIWSLGIWNVDVEKAAAYSFVVYTMILVQGLLGGVFFALRRRAFGDLDTEKTS